MLKIPMDMEIYRRPYWSDPSDMGDRYNGCFVIPVRGMVIVVSTGEGWEHVSVSLKDRCPTWDEMEWAKHKFWEDGDTVMQLHVPTSDHLNFHRYCLHLWRPLNCEIPRPPGIFVAPAGVGMAGE
jgi:hypothetical protein